MPDPIDPTVPQAVLNAAVVRALLDPSYSRESLASRSFTDWPYRDMTPVVRRAEAHGETNRWGDLWYVEVQYSSRGARAGYGINASHVPTLYCD